MAVVSVLKVEWSGFVGGPGLSQFVLEGDDPLDLQPALQALEDFFVALAPLIPNNILLTPQTEALHYEHTTGVLLGATQLTAVGASTGTATGTWAAACGGSIQWDTGQIQNGRRVRGRTFIVPMAVNAYEDDGTLTSTAVSTMTTASGEISTFVGPNAANTFQVWGRPRDATETQPAKPASLAQITGASVSDKVAILRGRRD